MARIFHLKSDKPRADMAFKFCLDSIERHRKRDGDSEDADVLQEHIQDWYAQYLTDMDMHDESIVHLKEAHKLCKKTRGEKSKESMHLLNNLGVTYFRTGDLKKARDYLRKAIDVADKIKEMSEGGVIRANLGMVLLENGMVGLAHKHCHDALRLGKKHRSVESMEEAYHCIEQIKNKIKSVKPNHAKKEAKEPKEAKSKH